MFDTIGGSRHMTLRGARIFGGRVAALVPCALLVHLVAEAAAADGEGLNASFLLRHAYLGAMLLGTIVWFARTVGLGKPSAERRRRCALLLSELAPSRRPQTFVLLSGANLAFFALTQAVEGVPIASGAMALGMLVGVAGSVATALAIVLFGSSLAAAGVDVVIATAPVRRACAALTQRDSHCTFAAARHATFAYSLFIPNRPPPPASRI